MLVSTVVSLILFLTYLLTNSSSPMPEQKEYSPAYECSETSADVYLGPSCEPRDTVVELPFPNDPMIAEVIPSHVLVQRCSGACHQGITYHKCVPEPGGRSKKIFKVCPRCLYYFLLSKGTL